MAIYQFVALQSLLGQQVRNVFYYDASGIPTAADIQAAVDDARANWATWVGASQISNNWLITGYHVRRVTDGSYLGADYLFTGGNVAGADTSATYATQVALLVTAKATTVKPNQARTYLAGYTIDAIGDNGLFASAELVAAENLLAALDTLTGNAITFTRVTVTLSPVTGLVTAYNVLDLYDAREVPATQRRRRIGVGA